MVIKNNYIYKKKDFYYNNYYNTYKKIKIIIKCEGDGEWVYIIDKNFLYFVNKQNLEILVI